MDQIVGKGHHTAQRRLAVDGAASTSKATYDQIELTEQESVVFESLRRIRDAPGTLYSRELASLVTERSKGSTNLAATDEALLGLLNRWFTEPLVLVDSSSSRSIPGMLELVTATKYREFIDTLISLRTQSRPRIHPDGVVVQPAERTAEVTFSYPEFKLPGEATTPASQAWAEVARQRYAEVAAPTPQLLTRLDQASLGSSVVALEDSPILLIKLDNSFVENFNIEEFVRGLPGDAQNRRIRLMAWNTVFGGDRTHLGGVTYDILDAEWAIFTSPLVSFDGACFDCEAEDDEGLLEQAVNLRDTTFTPSVRRVSFDDCIFTGDTRELTFEDAVFSGAHVSFARTDFGSTELYCYQAVFGGGTAIEFIEARQEGARFSFADAQLGGHGQAEGRLTFYRVNPLPQLDLSFRNADTVHLENSTLIAPLRVANIRTISLWATAVSGAPIAIDHHAEAHGRRTGRTSRDWFLDAIANGRTERRAELAAEYAVIKEIFQAMGEYDLEDEAFVRHMRYKQTSLAGRATYGILDRLGRFGTAPALTLGWFAATWAVFCVINLLLLVAFPLAFVITGSTGSVLIDAIFYTSASLIQADWTVVPVQPLVYLLWFAQCVVGWFFLGYFFAAFVRRTLR